MTHPPKVLVVDDEPDLVRYLEHVPHRLGYETARAENGSEAIERAALDPPDLIFLDVMMPVMDGFAVCRSLREREATRLTPVIVMTALEGIENRVKLLEHGADDVLAKPVDERELVARVQGALARKRELDHRLGELARVRDHFAKFVPEAVRRLVLANPDAPGLDKQERDVTVLFVDISGYSSLAERRRPRRPQRPRRALLRQLPGPYHRAGGDINETSGDGFMAIFQDGDPAAHAARTVNAALRFAGPDRGAEPEGGRVSARHPHRDQFRAGPGGLHPLRGPARHPLFIASGIVTTLAARLASSAGDGEILAGPETVRRLGGRYRLERVGRERLKNLAEAIEVHRIISPPSRR